MSDKEQKQKEKRQTRTSRRGCAVVLPRQLSVDKNDDLHFLVRGLVTCIRKVETEIARKVTTNSHNERNNECVNYAANTQIICMLFTLNLYFLQVPHASLHFTNSLLSLPCSLSLFHWLSVSPAILNPVANFLANGGGLVAENAKPETGQK